MTVAYRARYTVTDQVFTQIPGFFVDSVGNGLGMLDLIANMTSAEIVSYRATIGTGYADVGTKVDTTPDCLQGATLVFSTAVGGTARVLIPSSESALYLGDGNTIDLTQSDVTALAAYMVAHGLTRGGHAITALIRGYRVGLPAIPISRYR